MRIERPREIERFGAVRFGGLQKVFERCSRGQRQNVFQRREVEFAHCPVVGCQSERDVSRSNCAVGVNLLHDTNHLVTCGARRKRIFVGGCVV